MSGRTIRVRRILIRRILVGAVLAGAGIFLWLRFSPYGDFERFKVRFYSPVLYSREGTLLAVLPLEEGLRRQHLDASALSKEQVDLILASEDRRFYRHPGVDVPALLRSSLLYLKTGEVVSGGSTITMQLARIISSRPPGIRGKLLEIYNALRLETRLEKDDILTLYLSNLPFGSNLEGLESASYHFFLKSASELSREELLVLMMIPRRPGSFNPLVSPEGNSMAVERTLSRLPFVPAPGDLEDVYGRLRDHRPSWPRRVPHFTAYVKERLSREEWIRGAQVYTSLNLDFQEAASEGLKEVVESASEFRISNGAVIILDNSTGEILAYQGSVDFYDTENQGQIDGVRILRQPGSTLKPFLYAMALEQGFTASSILPDIPMDFGRDEIYVPENYNRRFNGPVRLSVALGSSLNVPAVYMAERLGVEAFRERLVRAGFASLEGQKSTGVGLALGNGEVRLLELARGFSVFTREGMLIPLEFRRGGGQEPNGITSGEDVLEESGQPVFTPEAAGTIRNILSSKQNRVLGFGRVSPLDVEFDALFKTGTSNQFNNIWAVGSTQDITCAVWMGNFSGETVIGAPGSSFPARLTASLLKTLHRREQFETGVSFQQERICTLSGAKAGPRCPYTVTELFPEGTLLSECSWHKGSQVFLPVEYSPWIESRMLDYRVDDSPSPVRFLQPGDGSVFYFDPTIPAEGQSIPVHVSGTGSAELYINGELVYQGEAPFSRFHPLSRGSFTLELKSSRTEETIRILVK
ncbi:MAG: transglycosylase domain-containing protein [Spirochaetales bacterium]|nr:transglycosylase domain-containing protein [Spirochaetales bacterium]